MSFLHVVGTIFHDVQIGASIAAPAVTAFNPGAGAALQGVLALVLQAEAKFTAPKSGDAKRDFVLSGILPIVLFGLNLTGAEVDTAAVINSVTEAINGIVKVMNSLAEVHAAIKLPAAK